MNSNVSTPEYLVAMGERRKPRRQLGGFQKLTTPAKKTQKKTQRKLFTAKPDVGVSDEESELSTADDESTRSDTPPKDRRRERDDGEMKAERRRLSAQVTQLRDATAAQSGTMDDEYEESTLQDMSSGATCGVKRGEPGYLVDRNQCEHDKVLCQLFD